MACWTTSRANARSALALIAVSGYPDPLEFSAIARRAAPLDLQRAGDVIYLASSWFSADGATNTHVAAEIEDALRAIALPEESLQRQLLHRTRALLGNQPEERFQLALAEDGYPLQTARTRLLYGE
ncbi:hypothetical protein ABGB17_25090 [Sphaerisporangium sp. B11E5]|uniref:hypothetical protein n=1 Tax=Sphaerisporangium sp. B11E5 TaxID=3153563 RepID=UPI00325C5E57